MEYSPEQHELLLFYDDETTSLVNDLFPEQNELIEKLLHYYASM